MTRIDKHLTVHARLDGVAAMAAYIVALFMPVYAIGSQSVATMATLNPLSAMVMLGASAVVLELVRVSPHAEN